MELETKKDLDVAPPLVVGDRKLFVVSERFLVNIGKKSSVFGMLISPIYIVVVEPSQSYAFSLLDGRGVELEELFRTNLSLKEKLLLLLD